jgi:hypothetical protein
MNVRDLIAKTAYNAITIQDPDEDETAWDVAVREGYYNRTRDMCLAAADAVLKELTEQGLLKS